MTHLFTIICQYRGGTYTRQLTAESPAAAFHQWAGAFQQEGFLLPEEQALFVEAIAYALREDTLVALESLQNAWYEGFSLKKNLLEVILIGTSEQSFSQPEKETAVSADVDHI
jgi:hypothetical protein